MITFEVKDMTCGHCVSAVAKALKAVDELAKFSIDRATSLVTIELTDVDPKELQEAIADAGYTPVRVKEDATTAPAKAEACCGHCQ